MPYVERVTKAGNTIEIERYFTSRYKKKGISRGDKVKPTKEEQEKVNTRQAERKLRILINANYGYGDYHLVLDYIRRKGESDRNVALKHNMETRKFRPIKIEQRAHIDGFVSVIDAMTVRQKYWEECGELLKNAA